VTRACGAASASGATRAPSTRLSRVRAGGAEGEGAPAQRGSTPVQSEKGQRPGEVLPDAGAEDGRPRKRAASTDFIASAITRRFG